MLKRLDKKKSVDAYEFTQASKNMGIVRSSCPPSLPCHISRKYIQQLHVPFLLAT